MDDPALGGVGTDPIHPAQQQRMVGDDHRVTVGDGRVDHLVGDVDGQQDRLGRFGRITAHQPHRIPALRQHRRVGTVEYRDHIGDGHRRHG